MADNKNSQVTLRDLETGELYQAPLPATIGRSSNADIRLKDPGVSRMHARIEAWDNAFKVTDLESSNGLYLNGERVSGAAIARAGDILTLGGSRLQVDGDEAHLGTETVILHATHMEEKWHVDARRLQAIYEIAVGISESADLDGLMDAFFSSLGEVMVFDRYFLVVIDDSGLFSVRYPGGINGLPLSRSIARKVLLSGQALLLRDALSDSTFSMEESIMAMQVRSALAAPLRFKKKIFGLIYLERKTAGAFTDEDLEFLRAAAFITGPIMENARLRQEIEKRYHDTLSHLRQTEARLIDMERLAAFARLAQVVAHEIRNPVMIAGGLLRRLKVREGGADAEKVRAVMKALEGIDNVVREVDSFVNLKPPRPELTDLAPVIERCLESMKPEFAGKGITWKLSVSADNSLAFIDEGLFSKGICFILRELVERPPEDRSIHITLARPEAGGGLEITFGKPGEDERLVEPFSREILGAPWRFGLFLTMAYKVMADHGARMLINARGNVMLPIRIELRQGEANTSGQAISA